MFLMSQVKKSGQCQLRGKKYQYFSIVSLPTDSVIVDHADFGITKSVGTPPLSKGWGRPEADINPQTDHRSTQDSRQDSSLYKHFLVFYIIQ
jgi:hypothetical protein